MATKIQHIRTLRLKMKAEAMLAQCCGDRGETRLWNFANATSYKAARPFAGPPQWLTAFDLDKLTAGASQCFERIGSDTIQRVNAEFATRRRQFKLPRLGWRVSKGAKRSLGWVPFKAAQLQRKGKSCASQAKAFRVFERERLDDVKWKCGCFAQDAVGDWWLCLPVALEASQSVAPKLQVGIDLGVEHVATTSDGDQLTSGRFYRHIEQKIAHLSAAVTTSG